ncbi:MAG: cobalamin-independent methionine synthase II family protein [Limnohabitans sp.]|jgi:5-methyltetrahydropteroyltriglutamate--homocysteine methyltransferase|uniref:cobalamin-independent methionine synthase II family protein n=1 Tax=Limnohabitans sp. TaxID=1907725 RepID=UPI0025EB4AB1|nr:cobalamin-independent methionine synthase II family protein [Limnohabitans sp.]MCO4088696.1 cobalamin-independent methionine synthase II family protein [Limnohabitans sp.]
MNNTNRILTTLVGSLPRPEAVVEQLFAQDSGLNYNEQQFDKLMKAEVLNVVTKQKDSGVDVVSDGEMSKISYATYIRHRLTGFEIGEMPRATPKDLDDFPDFKERLAKLGATPKYHRPICTGPIAVKDLSGLHKDIDNLKAACQASGVERGFMNSASPGVIAVFQPNQYYANHEKYLSALADAMAAEYEAIVASGLELQIDAPDLAMGRHIRFRDASDTEFMTAAEQQVEALNHALRNVPAERVRMHICWGNYEGPHHHDIELKRIIGLVCKAKPATILFEGANPRHAHEWEVWADAQKKGQLPDNKILCPGVLDSVNNFIEHPRLIAQRLLTYANIVGRERIMAGTDCGFGTFAGYGAIHPSIGFAKLKSMAEGAAMASQDLWS